ncbi:MAG: helix-turn-helix domain-containing protein [Actinomycetales bacterium]|nr:helix-turn-helix domain-containing protein [Actinomycetales bacterium]
MAVQKRTDPSVHRRRLRSELRRARETAGFTQRDVARAMDWSLSKLIRIETGAVSITTNDLRALLGHYGINDPIRVENLIEVARSSRERSWWSVYRDIASPEYIAFLGYESSASIIRSFQPLLVPGLLQTEGYANELFRHIRGPKDPKRIDALVSLRMERQEILVRPDPPELHFIMDEAVIRRMVGGPEIMLRQLSHIRDMLEQPNITIRIVPFSSGMYRSLRVPYVIFEFSDPEDEAVLYLEYPNEEMIIHESALHDDQEEGSPTPATYLEIFWQLEQAAKKEDTEAILDHAIGSMNTTKRTE